MTADVRVRRRADGCASALRVATVLACTLAGPSAALAQGADEVSTARALLTERVAQEAPAVRAPVFITEWAGGSLGSMAGLGLGLAISRPDRCDGDDIECVFDRLGIVWLVTSLGAGAGVQIGGRLGDTNPSLTGALIGGVLGAAVGAVALAMLDEASRGTTDGVLGVATFSVTQGLVSALGSRIGRAIGSGR